MAVVVELSDANVALLEMEVLDEVDEPNEEGLFAFAQIHFTEFWNLFESAGIQTLSPHNMSEPSISGLSQRHSRLPLLTKQAREALKKEKPSFRHGT